MCFCKTLVVLMIGEEKKTGSASLVRTHSSYLYEGFRPDLSFFSKIRLDLY